MASQKQAKTELKRSAESITVKVSESARPTGLVPPSFPDDYVAGFVAPFLLSGSYVGETPSLPMIDIAPSKEKAVPIRLWGMSNSRNH